MSKPNLLNPELSTRFQSTVQITPSQQLQQQKLTRIELDAAFELLSKDGKKITQDNVTKFYRELLNNILSNKSSSSQTNKIEKTIIQQPAPPSSQPTTTNVEKTPQSLDQPQEKQTIQPHPPSTTTQTKKQGDPTFLSVWQKNKREELTKDGLYNLLIRKSLSSYPFEDIFAILDPLPGDAAGGGGLSGDFLKRFVKSVNPYGTLHKGDLEALVRRFDGDGDGVIGFADFCAVCGNVENNGK